MTDDTLYNLVDYVISEEENRADDQYTLKDFPEEANELILYADRTFLTPDLMKALRERLVFVTGSSTGNDGFEAVFFLNYLEDEEDTFMDNLATDLETKQKWVEVDETGEDEAELIV